MKRTNLVLDEDVLAEATRLGGQKTYSATVNVALRDFVRRVRAQRILLLRGSGAWEGSLSQMRGDLPVATKPGRRGERP
jgi:Arc/MetJ family transcription regulator